MIVKVLRKEVYLKACRNIAFKNVKLYTGKKPEYTFRYRKGMATRMIQTSKVYKCFPNGKFKVLTTSYDDGQIHDRQLVEIFNRYGIKGTFHLNSGLFEKDPRRLPKEEIKDLYKGHEIACHTLTHPTIALCPLPMTAQQILEDRINLEEITGAPVRGLSYPNGSYNEEIKALLKPLGIEYSRVVGNTDDFSLPNDYYEWKATCHHKHNLAQNAERFLKLSTRQYLYLFYVWGHSYEFNNDKNWDLIEDFCQMVSGKDDIWYATNIEIVDYLRIWDNLRFTAKGNIVYNPSAQSAFACVNDEIIEIKGGTQTILF
jgi:peptidoglycan/xylan/chitin deacetylase (PgdA/CDA1 family)